MPETDRPTSVVQDLVIVIDHAGARLLPIGREADTPHERHHLLHQSDRTQRDADRAEANLADTRFFAAVATAVVGSGRIVVIGHGKGQSNEAGHLMPNLGKHDAGVRARVAAELNADLPHSTVPQLLAFARQSLWPALKSAGAPAD